MSEITLPYVEQLIREAERDIVTRRPKLPASQLFCQACETPKPRHRFEPGSRICRKCERAIDEKRRKARAYHRRWRRENPGRGRISRLTDDV